jgi:hypothetical protein
MMRPHDVALSAGTMMPPGGTPSRGCAVVLGGAPTPFPTDRGLHEFLHPAPSCYPRRPAASEARQAHRRSFFGQAFRACLVYSIFPGVWLALIEPIERRSCCIDRIVFIFCAIGWMLGPALGQDVIKITQPLTGAFAASGNSVAQGAKMA